MEKAIGNMNEADLGDVIVNHIENVGGTKGYVYPKNFLYRDLFIADHSRPLDRDFFDKVFEGLLGMKVIVQSGGAFKVVK